MEAKPVGVVPLGKVMREGLISKELNDSAP
jgi:hypothetical protein